MIAALVLFEPVALKPVDAADTADDAGAAQAAAAAVTEGVVAALFLFAVDVEEPAVRTVVGAGAFLGGQAWVVVGSHGGVRAAACQRQGLVCGKANGSVLQRGL